MEALGFKLLLVDSSMNLTMDLTVAMACECELSFLSEVALHQDQPLPHVLDLGVDYIDVSGTSTDVTEHMAVEPAHFELSPNQQEWLE